MISDLQLVMAPAEEMGGTAAGQGFTERSPWVALLCAIVERAVDDVRAIRRQGLLNEDGTLIDGHNPRIPGASEKREAARTPARDAIAFFSDGRLDRVVNLINSESLHADRIKSHVFSPRFQLDKAYTSQMGH